MPLETTTTRLQQITAKSGTKKDGDTWTRYDFQLDGFKRPWSTFDKTLVDMSLQGKMVQASGSAEERTFQPQDSAHPVTFTQYTLQNIVAVEGDTGTLDDVLTPVAQQQAVQTVVNRTNGETPSSPSEAVRQAGINRAVAFKGAVDMVNTYLAAGGDIEGIDNKLLELTNKGQQILESR